MNTRQFVTSTTHTDKTNIHTAKQMEGVQAICISRAISIFIPYSPSGLAIFFLSVIFFFSRS